MAFCFGNLLKIVKKYQVDQTKSNIAFVNEFFGCLMSANSANSYFECESLEKSVVSNILNCKREVPKAIKTRLGDNKLKDDIVAAISHYAEDNLQQGCFDDFSADVLKLCCKENELQENIFNRLNNLKIESSQSEEKSEGEILQLSNFLTVALIEAANISNKVDADYIIAQRGSTKLCLHSGDIFSFGFSKKNKSKNIIVVPVNTKFDLHISRKFEGHVKQVVSIETLHGMWIDRMIRRSVTKEKVDNKWLECNEETLNQRIIDDLTVRQMQPENGDEYTIGTIAVIEEEDAIFYLLATSRFDENNNAHATQPEIKKALTSLVQFYDANGQGLNIYLPLIGTGMSRAGFSNQETFDEICKAFNPQNNSYVGKVTIVVLPEVFETLSLNRVMM